MTNAIKFFLDVVWFTILAFSATRILIKVFEIVFDLLRRYLW